MSDRGSLLSLDSVSSEEQIRLAIYDRALSLHKITKKSPGVTAIAESFVEFVRGERLRLDALDLAFQHADRFTSADRLLDRAEKIVAWAAPPVEPVAADLTTTKKTSKKKATKKE